MPRKREENQTYNTCEQQEGMIYNSRAEEVFPPPVMHVNVRREEEKRTNSGKDEELLVDNSKGERLWIVLYMIDGV